ncbi:uncharacterized protein LOC109728859 isoform X2 [Ananas comosus]|uniref:Uncharacterized protein LOC109728859 isoform X2 n=1 Tax=Ananas comosus TaxID=4615 RepID=A0A6P5H6U8_ANACO|nr:uncharacterized protein LOC109728859 isoform X2 [Ananas comosus]
MNRGGVALSGDALSGDGGSGGASPPPAAAAVASSLSPDAPPFTLTRPSPSSSTPFPAPTRRLSSSAAAAAAAVVGADPFNYHHRPPPANGLGSVGGAFDSFGVSDRRGGGERIGPSLSSQKGSMAIGVDSCGTTRHDKNVDSITRNVKSGSASSMWRYHVQPMRPNSQSRSPEWPDNDISATYGQSVTFPYDTSGLPEFASNTLCEEGSYSLSQLPTTNYVEDYYCYPSATYSTSTQLLTPSPTRAPFSKGHRVVNIGYSTVNSIEDKAQQTTRSDHHNNEGKVARSENITAEKSSFENGSSSGNKLSPRNFIDCANGPVLTIKHLDIPNALTFAIDSTLKSEDSMQNSSELDSPCWRGTLASKLSAYKAGESSTPFAIKHPENFNTLDPEQMDIFRSAEHSECPVDQNGSLISDDSEKKFSASPMESSFAVSSNIQKKSANSSKTTSECAGESHGKGVQCANVYTKRTTEDQKRAADVKDNGVAHSGAQLSVVALNHFVSANGKSYPEKGRRSSSRKNIHALVETMHSQSEMLLETIGDCNNEMAEQDCDLLHLVIENLETLLDKNRKGFVKDISNHSELKALRTQNAGRKVDIDNRSNVLDVHNTKGQMSDNSSEVVKVYSFSNSQEDYVLNQPSLQAFEGLRKITFVEEEEHPRVLLYKNLWINAEIATCQLKYELQNARMECEMETGKNHTRC